MAVSVITKKKREKSFGVADGTGGGDEGEKEGARGGGKKTTEVKRRKEKKIAGDKIAN